MLCCFVLYCSLLCRVVVCCTVLCCAVLCCAVSCCGVLCCAVLYYAVLCCVVLCCAVLCCVVLCWIVWCCYSNAEHNGDELPKNYRMYNSLSSAVGPNRRLTDRKSGQKKLCRAVCVSALVECEMRTERDRKHRLLTSCLSTHILVSTTTPVRPVPADTICREPGANSNFFTARHVVASTS